MFGLIHMDFGPRWKILKLEDRVLLKSSMAVWKSIEHCCVASESMLETDPISTSGANIAEAQNARPLEPSQCQPSEAHVDFVPEMKWTVHCVYGLSSRIQSPCYP